PVAEPEYFEPKITINEKIPEDDVKIELVTPEEFYSEKASEPIIEEPVFEEPVIEEAPFETDQQIPLSNEKPYSILIRSYKNETNAQKDLKRLSDLGFSPYIVKTYDEENYFSFNIHAGACEKMEEAFPIQEELSKSGIDFAIISDFKTFKDKIAQFDKLNKENKVNYEVSDKNLADIYSENVLNCIINFPTAPQFGIDQVGVFDFSNIEDGADRIASLQSLFSTVKNIDFSTSTISCCSFCVFTDELYSKSISAAMFSGSDFNYKAESQSNIKPFTIKSGEMDCVLDNDENSTYLFCISKDKGTFIFLETTDYSQEELFALFNNNIENQGLLAYDEVKNTLLILPDKSAKFDAKFRSFMLEKVTYEYSKGREYSPWSTPLVGQWFAEGSYLLKDEILSLGYFYLNYDYIANLTHDLFMEAKIQDKDTEKESHYSTINDGNSWYLDNEFMKELSFTEKAYIFAIDVFSDSIFTEDNLIEISRQLKIW
nr:SPOR domain-containing protein [Treponemataceae bacterium]